MDRFLHPIIVAFAWVWVKIYDLVAATGLDVNSGARWVISIVVLTLLVRLLILPLYLKQIKSQRGMQAIQPEIQRLQAKYKGKKDSASRQKQSEEMMALYKKHGTSPYSSCLPLIVQMPVLFALYRVIYAVQALAAGTYGYPNLGPLTKEVALEISNSTVFGVGLFETLRSAPGLGKAVFVVLIVFMVGFQFMAMYMGLKQNTPPSPDPNNPMVRSQKTMLYMMPAMFAFMGFIFQMALLIYMVTTAVVSWAQQLWVIKYMPTPGAPAYERLVEKREERYQAWGEPYFAGYRATKAEISKDPQAVDELNAEALKQVRTPAREAHIYSDFPDTWSDADKVALYQDLAVDKWDVLPDERWFNGVVRSKKVVDSGPSRAAQQPKRLSREQRQRQAEKERAAKADEARAEERARRREAQRKKKPGSNLTPEEIEQRRQQRRAAERARRKSGRKEPPTQNTP